MSEDLKWLIGIALGQFTFYAGAIFAAFSRLAGKMSANDKDLHARVDRANERIEEVRRDYVRRDDFAEHMTRIEQGIAKLDGKFDEAIRARRGS